MRRIFYVLPVCLLLTGCEGKVADFAKRTADLLTEYQKRIDVQIATSTTYYQNAAGLLATEARRITLTSLQAERNERSTELQADYTAERKSPYLYRTHLREYADGHFERQKEWLTADSDGSGVYLAQLVALEADKATIDAYGKMLKSLAEPRSLKAEAGDIQAFVQDGKKEYQLLVCKDIASDIDGLSKAPAGETDDAKKARTTKLDAAQQRKTDQNCQKILCDDTAQNIADSSKVPANETADAKKARETKLAAANQRKTNLKCQ